MDCNRVEYLLFMKLKEEGKVVDEDWDKFIRDKAVRFYKQTGKEYDLERTMTRDRAKDYKKFQKEDTLGGLWEGETLSAEEVKRMERVYSAPTMDDWKIEAHRSIHDPDTIVIPEGFDEGQKQEARQYIDSMRVPEQIKVKSVSL